MPQEENEDDLYAYDTVADQTDAEIAGIGRFFNKLFVLIFTHCRFFCGVF